MIGFDWLGLMNLDLEQKLFEWFDVALKDALDVTNIDCLDWCTLNDEDWYGMSSCQNMPWDSDLDFRSQMLWPIWFHIFQCLDCHIS